MKLSKLSILTLVLIFAFSCNDNIDPIDNVKPGNAWLIPSDEVRDGGPGKDGIPSVDNPKFANVNATSYLNDDDLIVGVKLANEIRGYTHPVLDWHEIVNDEIGPIPLALTYCPLTGTAIGWSREVDGQITEFGVSGLLYNTNLIPYDRKTDSNWSQMRLDCVNGPLKGTRIETIPVFETTWATWKELFPDSKVMTTETGHNRPYGNYPYFGPSGQDYRTSNSYLIFPLKPFDERLPAKERVLGIIVTGNAKAYRFQDFETESVNVIQDEFEGKSLVIVGSKSANWMVAFERKTKDSGSLDFSPVQNEGSVVMTDGEGNKWNVWGEAVEGPRTGQQLIHTESFIGYWMAWGAFYPGMDIYE